MNGVQIAQLVLTTVLGVAALMLLWRIARAPSVLDRVIAADALLATLMCAIAVDMAVNRHTDTLPVLLVLALFAVVGSVSVARFISREEDR